MKFRCATLLFVLSNAIAFAQQSLDSRLSVVDSIVNDAIGQQQIPGAVLIVGHNGQIVYRKAYGDRSSPAARAHDARHDL